MIISFEGQDGSGKSTIISVLKSMLEIQGYKTLVLKTPPAELNDLRKKIDNLNNVETSFDFYVKGLNYTSSILKENKDKYDFIFVDRYFHSTIVSHTFRGMNLDNNYFDYLVQPDLSIYLKTSLETRKDRIQNRLGNTPNDVFSLNQEIVRKSEEIYNRYNFVYIQNEETIDQAINDILEVIEYDYSVY